jgi:hypothetical protein
MSNINWDTSKFSKSDVLKIIEVLGILSKECESREVRFSQFTKEEIWEFFMAYRAYRLSGEPPF